MEKIRIGICGYGNIGKGVEAAVNQCDDMELIAVFSRRKNIQIASEVPVIDINDMDDWASKIDVMILCSGSMSDLPVQGPEIAKKFCTVDSFDTHKNIPQYFENVDLSARGGKNVSIISTGWDPGLFSINRVYMDACLPFGETYTFWGKGVSQGHSDAIRRIDGVKNAIQYTIPYEEAINKVRNGENPELTIKDKHYRVCYVVLQDGADPKEVEKNIKTMPNYFADYNTEVNFISEEELIKKHSKMPHGGFVIRSGKTRENEKQIMEFSLNLESNPGFTGSVMVCFARAVYKLKKDGEIGAKTVLDIPPKYLSNKKYGDLLEKYV